MTTPRGTATTPQEQDTNKSSQTPRPPPGWPYNGPKDEPLFVSQGESEHNSRRDNERVHQSKPNSEDTLYWPCKCGDGYNTAGEWIRCDKPNCRLKWYHLACVGLDRAPAEKWICRECRARIRKVAVAKPDPKKKGIAIKVTPKKGKGRRKSWRELPSDEGEEYKRKVDSSREVKILPGKTRSGAGQDAVYSEDESESTENEKTPQQKTRRGGPKQIDTLNEDSNALGSGADSHVSTPGGNFDTDYPEGPADAHSHVSTPGKNFYADHPEGSADANSHVSTPGKNFDADYPDGHADIRAFRNNVNDWGLTEDLGILTNVQSPRTPAPGSEFWSETSEDEWDRDPEEPDEATHTEQATTEDEPTSLAEDLTKSKDRETVVDVDETANDTGESTPESDLVSQNPPVRSSRPTTPEAASTLLSTGSTTTGEAHQPRTSGPVTHTEGDQALVAALRESWVGQYFA